MKKRTSSFLFLLAVMTGATLLLGARSEPIKINPESDAVPAAPESKQSVPAQPPAAVSKAAPQTKFSFGVDEVAKMHQNGVETDVILNYIENSNVPYHPNAEEIVRLHDLGVPSPLITAMIRHGAKVQQEGAMVYAQSQQKAAEEAKAAPSSANTYSAPVYAAPPPIVTYNYAYPQYVYSGYPSYAYSGFYSGFYFYPRYCYSGPYYHRYYSYPYCNSYYSHRGCYSYPHFGFGASFGHSPRWRVGARF